MKKNILRIIALILIVFWILSLFVSVMYRVVYNDYCKEPLENYLNKGLYNLFIVFSMLGTINSLFTYGCFAFTKNAYDISNSKRQKLRTAVRLFGIIVSVAFHFSVGVLLFLRNDLVSILVLSFWLISFLLTIILLIVYKVNDKKRKRDTGVGSNCTI